MVVAAAVAMVASEAAEVAAAEAVGVVGAATAMAMEETAAAKERGVAVEGMVARRAAALDS